MRALGKTPNDPLLQKMTPVQWKLCELNVIEDETETNKKIKDLVDIAIKLFVRDTSKSDAEQKLGSQQGYVGQEPTLDNPDISYTVGDNIGIRKVMSTEFDKIVKSGGKYQGFEVKE